MSDTTTAEARPSLVLSLTDAELDLVLDGLELLKTHVRSVQLQSTTLGGKAREVGHAIYALDRKIEQAAIEQRP